MVMPSMPASSSASLTASSLEGCSTASILTIKTNSFSSSDSVTGWAACLPPPDSNFLYPPEKPRRSSLECVAFLAVLRKIEAGHFLLRCYPQSHDLIDNNQENQRADNRDSPRSSNGGKLVEHLMPIAVDGAGGLAGSVDGIDNPGSEDAGEERSERSTRAVYAECIQRVIVAEDRLDLEDHEGAEKSRRKSNGERRHGLHESRSRSDGDKSRDRAGDCAQRRGLAIVNPLKDRPSQGGSGSGKMRGDESTGGEAIGRHRAACVKSEPAHPQQARTDEAQYQRVRRHRCVWIADALAYIKGADQRGNTARNVHHRAAREIEAGNMRAGRVEQATHAPHHVRHGAIDEKRP